MNRYQIDSSIQIRQRGFALAISMILLLVLTMLSLTAMRSANLDTKITINHLHKQLAFTSAENALAHLTTLDVPEMQVLQVPNVVGDYDAGTNIASNPTFSSDSTTHTSADLDMTMVEISPPGKYKFSGFGLNIVTIIYQADAVGTVANTNARSHNRMEVALIRD